MEHRRSLEGYFLGSRLGSSIIGIGNIFSVAKEGVQVATAFAERLGTVGTALVRSGLHAVSQGVLSLMQGEDFVQGFVSGGLGSLGAEAWGGAMKYMGYEKFAGSTVGTVAFGALSGGIGAELSGGNFWQGAVTGGIVAGLNHAMHKMGGEDPKPKKSKEDKYSNTKKTAAAVATTLGILVADDATVVGVVDDAAIPVVGIIGTVAIAGTAVYDYAKDIDFSKFDFKFDFASEHSKNKRPSNWNKHTKPRSGRSNTKNRQQPGWKPNPNKRIK